jgi:hypothetical protein
MTTPRATRRLLGWALGTIALALVASPAFARSEVLRWSHPDPTSVVRFTIHVGTASRSYTQTIDAGKPTPVNGVFSFTITVNDPDNVYVAVSATDANGLTSALSNEQLRMGILGTPGAPQIQ